MTLLMDTHVFLWWVTDAPGLSSRAREEIANPGNDILLSAASGWEIAIKSNLGRLEMPTEPQVFVQSSFTATTFVFFRSACTTALLSTGCRLITATHSIAC